MQESVSCRTMVGRDIYMRNALHTAVLEKDVDFIRSLLNEGSISCESKAMDDATPLHLACKGRSAANDTVIAQMILEQSTGRSTIDWQTKPKHKKSHQAYTPATCGYTPLLYAIKAENPAMVKLLLEYGASLELPGWTPSEDANSGMQKVCPPLLAAKERRDYVGSPATISVLEILQNYATEKERTAATAAAAVAEKAGDVLATAADASGGQKKRRVSSGKDVSAAAPMASPLDLHGHVTTHRSAAQQQYLQMLDAMDADPDGSIMHKNAAIQAITAASQAEQRGSGTVPTVFSTPAAT